MLRPRWASSVVARIFFKAPLRPSPHALQLYSLLKPSSFPRSPFQSHPAWWVMGTLSTQCPSSGSSRTNGRIRDSGALGRVGTHLLGAPHDALLHDPILSMFESNLNSRKGETNGARGPVHSRKPPIGCGSLYCNCTHLFQVRR